MPDTKKSIHEEKTKPEVDEYTVQMDRMVNNLKTKSRSEHQKQVKTMLIWILAGLVIVVGSIYWMLNVAFQGQPLPFL
ncbi:MAG: hypothetical protein JXR73_22315 [Candidatus Omnitrophica bacterium]|nr:hypothetical protein [Candidatus Omnitrophota bacterium]